MTFYCSGKKRVELYQRLQIDSTYNILFYPPPIRSEYGKFITTAHIPTEKPFIFANVRIEFASRLEITIRFGWPRRLSQDVGERELRVISSVINAETIEVYKHASKCVKINGPSVESLSLVFHHSTFKNTLVVVALGAYVRKTQGGPVSQSLAEHLEGLFESKRLSDATILSSGMAFRVHRAILVARSSGFAAMFEENKQSNRFTIDDVKHKKTMWLFLRYLYTDKLDDLTQSSAQRLFIAAKKYGVEKLRAKCVDFMRRNINFGVAILFLRFADHFLEENIKKAALIFIAENFDQIAKSKEWNELEKDDPVLGDDVKMFCTAKSIS